MLRELGFQLLVGAGILLGELGFQSLVGAEHIRCGGGVVFQRVAGAEIHLLGNWVFKVWSVLKLIVWGVGFSKIGEC